MNSNIDLYRDIYPRLSHAIIFDTLNPIDNKKYFIMDCPECKEKKSLYGYKAGKKYWIATCNHINNCGYSISWWDWVSQKNSISPVNKKEIFKKLAELAGFQLNAPSGPKKQLSKNNSNKHIEEDYFNICLNLLSKNKKAVDYLVNDRKIAEDKLKETDIGWRA